MCRDTELAVGAAAQAVENAGISTAGTSDEPPTIDPESRGLPHRCWSDFR